MRRAFIAGAFLLVFGVITAHSKPEPLTFVFLRVDLTQDVAILRPMIAPDLGVQLDPALQTLKPGTVLRCSAVTREHHATIDGQPAQVTELALDCLPAGAAGAEHQFVVRGLDFSPHR